MTGGQRVVSFKKQTPTHTPSQTRSHTLGLVRTPASSQQQGQAGCTSQSQHHTSEQSISEEKQRNRRKKGTTRARAERETWREDEEWKDKREPGKPFEAISCRRSGHPPPLSFALHLLLLFIALLLCFPPLLRAHSRPPASTPYWISVGIFFF